MLLCKKIKIEVNEQGAEALEFMQAKWGSRHFYPAESPLSLASCLLKRLSTLTGSPLWPGFARKWFDLCLPLPSTNRSA